MRRADHNKQEAVKQHLLLSDHLVIMAMDSAVLFTPEQEEKQRPFSPPDKGRGK